jgi:SAM-dependent methyltransferase
MALVRAIRSLLLDPRLQDVDIDSPEALELHRRITMDKPLMREVFRDFYDICINLAKTYLTISGKQVEIGGGGSFFKDYYPEVITTDIKPSRYLDMVLDAQDMRFGKEEIAVVYGINCFHHLPDPCRFFNELGRVLIPGGGCVLIEPYYNWISRLLYSNVHSQEHFSSNQRTWEAQRDAVGPMSGANQALSYIVFCRDRAQFEQKFPFLDIVYTRPMINYLRYLLSGGVNFRQLVPSSVEGVLRNIEFVLSPFAAFLALHHVLVLRKQNNG